MGVKERREREKSETRDKILDAARELFLSEGYDGVSMRKVAEKIEYSPTAIYLHFTDKEELFHELVHEDFARLATVFQSAAMPANPVERIREIGRTYVEFGTHYPNHYKLMFMTPHPHHTEEEMAIQKGNPEEDAYAFLKATVMEAIAGGRFRPELDDAEMLTQTMWAGMHGVVSLEIAKADDPWVEWRPAPKRARLMVDTLIRGLLRGES